MTNTNACIFQIGDGVLDGAKLISASGVARSVDPLEIDLTDSDPQLVFELSSFNRNWFACELTFEADLLGEKSCRPRLYLDYASEGFQQANSFVLSQRNDGTYRAIIALPALNPTFRWDPAEQTGRLSLRRIAVQRWNCSPSPEPLVLPIVTDASDEIERRAWAQHAFELTRRLNQRFLNAGVEVEYEYSNWLKSVEPSTLKNVGLGIEPVANSNQPPLFSFVIPTYNTPKQLLKECLASLQAQSYANFEICIADDNSTNPDVRTTLEELAVNEPRIKFRFRAENGHISEASNSALKLATGDFIVLVDHDDIIPSYALEIVKDYVAEFPNGKVFYSDEDKLDFTGRRADPYFKSGFNRFLMFGHNMVSHLGVYNRRLVNAVGGFRKGYEGSQDYDLLLRCLSECSDQDIVHIPHVLYNWRMIPGSTSVSADQKSYAIIAAQKSLNDFMEKQKLPFRSVGGITAGISAIEVTDAVPETSVSIVIPTRDRLDLLAPCINSLQGQTGEHVEIVIVDNGSTDLETLKYFDNLRRDPFIRIVAAPGEFNFSSICNLGVASSTGDIICLLNNDTELVSPQWLRRARAFLSVPDVAIVGARLLYPDQTVQHFGLYLGMGAHGVAGTPHRGQPSSDFGPFGKGRLVQEFSAVTAACMFIKRSVYDQVGGFDPDLKIAYNDVDFCLKVRALNLKVVCDPEIVLIHKESKSRGPDTDNLRSERLEKEAALMRDRWGPVLANDPYYNPNLTLERDDFSLAAVPRVPFSWQQSHKADDAAV